MTLFGHRKKHRKKWAGSKHQKITALRVYSIVGVEKGEGFGSLAFFFLSLILFLVHI